MSNIFESVGDFEERLSLPKDFYKTLLNEDDWSFVIKLSALFEAACTHTLVSRLGAKQIEDNLAFLDQANSKYGKIQLLKQLGAIYPEQAKFLDKIAELRNKLAHDISNVNFTFKQYVFSLDENQKKVFIDWAGLGVADNVKHEGQTIRRADFVTSNPKFSIWLTAAEVVACMYLEFEHAAFINKFDFRALLENMKNQ
jgi:hypothetical protein